MSRRCTLATPLLAAVLATETFNLDFAEKRITERDFHAATALEAGTDDGGIRIQAGASISARTIDARPAQRPRHRSFPSRHQPPARDPTPPGAVDPRPAVRSTLR